MSHFVADYLHPLHSLYRVSPVSHVVGNGFPEVVLKLAEPGLLQRSPAADLVPRMLQNEIGAIGSNSRSRPPHVPLDALVLDPVIVGFLVSLLQAHTVTQYLTLRS